MEDVEGAPPIPPKDAARAPLSRTAAVGQILKIDGGAYQEHRFLLDTKTGSIFFVDKSVEKIKETAPVERQHREIVASLVQAGVIDDPEKVVGGYAIVDGEGPDATFSFFGNAVTIKPALPDQFEKIANKESGPDSLYLIDQNYGTEPDH